MSEKANGKRQKAKVKDYSRLAYFFLLPFTFCLPSPAAGPSTQPTQQVKTWLDQLTDPTAAVRESARDHLMSLSAADLPTLERAVMGSRPLKPSQRAILRPIVDHLFKSGITYEPSAAGEGFLGVTWSYLEWDLSTDRKSGVIVTECEPGFPAYRLLKPGDVIVGIDGLDHIKFDEDNSQFQFVVRSFQPGQTINLKVRRNGEELEIPILLRPRPAGVETQDSVAAWRQEMQELADQYWDEHFSRIGGPT